MEWISQHFRELDGFPRPDWEAISADVKANHDDSNQHELWCRIARSWTNRLKVHLSPKHDVYESDNFIIVISESPKYISLFQEFLERTHGRILEVLDGIVSDDGYGKYVVLIFDDIDKYYSYLSHFYDEDGVYGLSSGVYLNNGYGHFALPHQELAIAEPIAAHEMTHALLSHLPIPSWLNEGIAVSVEDLLTGSSPLHMDSETYAKHQAFWSEDRMQEFWSGASFHRPDEGQELSYQLAHFAVNALSKDYEAFVDFSTKAQFADGGESAAREVYEGSLGNLIAQFLGEGNWAPNPNSWQKSNSIKNHLNLRKI